MINGDQQAAPVVGSFPSVSPSFLHQPESTQAIDQALHTLTAHKDEWLQVSIADRLQLLADIGQKFYALRSDWVRAGIAARGWPDEPYHVGFEWGAFACILRGIRVLSQTLRDIQQNGRPVHQCVLREDNGQIVARVFPQNLYDRALFMQTTADVFMQPGQTMSDVEAGWARIYHETDQVGRICLVLAAGNSAQITALVILHKLFVDNELVVVKTHPVNAYLTPFLQKAFAGLIAGGFLRFIEGGAAEGAYLCHHDEVDLVHLTGSDKTFAAIVFGTDGEAAARQREKRPLLSKPIQAELGAVSPILVVPGRWSQKDIDLQAELIVSWVVSNGGFNCLTPRVLLTHQAWPQRQALLQAIRRVLAQTPTLNAYYPGAQGRYQTYQQHHPKMEQYGSTGNGRLPWGFIPELAATRTNDVCFTAESYCGILAEVPLAAKDTAAYLDHAAAFANDVLWGNLSMTVIVDQNTLKDQAVNQAYHRALADLRYGSIGINFAVSVMYYLAVMPWGAYPGNQLNDIQSGIGFTNNFLMFSQPQKSICQAPFHKLVEPIRIGSKNIMTFGRRLTDFDAQPSVKTLILVTWAAMKS